MHRTYLFLLINFMLISCNTETAKIPVNRTLVIASDILSPKDSLLFSKFENSNKCKVEIRHLRMDSVINLISNSPYNHGVDIIFPKSAFYLGQMEYRNINESINNVHFNLNPSLVSKKYNYITIGYSPFVFANFKDSTINLSTYSELRFHKYNNKLSHTEKTVFYSGLYDRLGKVETYKWIESIHKHDTSALNISQIRSFSSTDAEKYDIFIPNQRVSGAFYDIASMEIAKQTDDYQLSQDFIEYCIQPGMNKQLCDSLNLISIEGTNEYRLFTQSPEQLIQYYGIIQRMLKNLDN